MIRLEDFVEQINEAGRGRPRKVRPEEVDTQSNNPDPKKIEGKKPEKNGSNGLFAVDEPTDDDAYEPLDKATMNANIKRLLMKIKAEDDFFIQGEAGWGKTSIIKNMAKRFGRTIVTVYLDKAVATDLGGIPIPVEGRRGNAEQKLAMPAWGCYILNNPEKKILLFFDEMNQAQPDVMNALMPIVLEHEICNIRFDNFFVGAAGNFEHENKGAITELSGPLKSRFAPIIEWESGDWAGTFRYLRNKKQTKFGDKTWPQLVGDEFINKMEECAQCFVNPRELEKKVIQWAYKLKQAGDNDYFDVEDYQDRLDKLVKEDLEPSEKKKIAKLAEFIYNWMNDLIQKKENKPSKKKMMPSRLREYLEAAIKNGYIDATEDLDPQGKNKREVRYGLSRENINILIDAWNALQPEDELTAEILDQNIRKLEKDGVKFKFEKDEEWEKAHFVDPERPDPYEPDYDDFMRTHPNDPDYKEWKNKH